MALSIRTILICGGAASTAGFGLTIWGMFAALTACSSLSNVTVLPDGTTDDLDAGFVTIVPPDAGPPATPPVDAGITTGRVRLANMAQGVGPVDLCVSRDDARTWDTVATKAGGVSYQEVSGGADFSAASGNTGTKYLFRVVPVGQPCVGSGVLAAAPPEALAADGGFPLPVPGVFLKRGGGLTITLYGVSGATGEKGLKAIGMGDTVAAASATRADLRVFNGVPDLAAVDLVLGVETPAAGVRFGSGTPFPYTDAGTFAGYAGMAGGVPPNTIAVVKSGAQAFEFKVPTRIRRGAAVTFFVSGNAFTAQPPLTVQICSDTYTATNPDVAECVKLEKL